MKSGEQSVKNKGNGWIKKRKRLKRKRKWISMIEAWKLWKRMSSSYEQNLFKWNPFKFSFPLIHSSFDLPECLSHPIMNLSARRRVYFNLYFQKFYHLFFLSLLDIFKTIIPAFKTILPLRLIQNDFLHFCQYQKLFYKIQ